MFRQIATITATAAAVLLATAVSASAHLDAYPTSTAAGSESLVRFVVPHACDDKPTTKIEMQFPDEVAAVRPVQSALWNVSGGTSAPSHAQMNHDGMGAGSGHGDSQSADHDSMNMNEHDSASGSPSKLVTWTAKTPLPGEVLGTIEAWLVIPNKPGETLWMPAIQTCQGGATNKWISKEESAEFPSPELEITAADASGHHDAADGASSRADTASTKSTKHDDEEDSALGLVGVILGALGVLLGGGALLRIGRRRP